MKTCLTLMIMLGLVPQIWAGDGHVTLSPSPGCATQEDPNGPMAVSGDVERLLDRVEKRGTELSSFQANMTMKELQQLVDALTIRQGSLYYQVKDQEVGFRLHFETWQQLDLEDNQPSAPVKQDLDWVFDGRWLHKRDARTKTLQSWEVSKEPARRTDFTLGKGPFPLPFAIRKDDVVKQFDIKLMPADPNDPARTDHVFLTPRKDSKFAEEYIHLELWILQDQAVPIQLRFERNDSEITTVTWSDWNIDVPIPAETFTTMSANKGWTVEKTPL